MGPTDGGGATSACINHLRDAFWRYADAAGHRWKIKIGSPSQHADGPDVSHPEVIQIELVVDDAERLADVLTAAAAQVRGGGLRSRPGTLIGTADVAAQLHVQPATIRGWLARHGPKGNPFPAPNERYHGWSYWKQSAIDAWVANQGR